MSKKDYYIIEKNISKILRGETTNFLDPLTYSKISQKLNKYKFNTYYPYKESEKVIIYTNNLPKIKLLEIETYEPLTHRSIMGSLYGLNIDGELFGDIIIYNNHYYIMVVESIYNLIMNEFNKVGNYHIKLKERPISVLNDYQRQYQEINIIVSSLRIDNVISRLIGTSRDQVKIKFNNDEIFLNYQLCNKITTILKPNDVFSIRKYGKYKYVDIINKSKKNNYVIKCYKYIDS